MSLARTYWENTVFVLRDWGQYHPPLSAANWGTIRTSGLLPSVHIPNLQPPGFRMVLPPISQDSDGIPQYVLARLTVFSQHTYTITQVGL